MQQGYPKLMRVQQRLHRQAVANIDDSVGLALQNCSSYQSIKPGQRVAIAVGSRGIANLKEIVSSLVRRLQQIGAMPMIVPAMGSHGGATAVGQVSVLASLGITETSVGCPIESSMETISIGKTTEGFDVRFDKTASQSDHVIVVNRIKPHTRLIGTLQSGLVKMMLVGLGNHDGAAAYHVAFASHHYRWDEIAIEIANMILASQPITLGISIIEDGAEQTSHIEAVPAELWLNREPQLLKIAANQMPSLPFETVDFLIVDRIGKEISGTGMDTNVVGRKWNDGIAAVDEWPKIKEIYVRRLTDKTAGNANGIGIATYCHQAVIDAMDADITRTNCITSGHPTSGRIPLVFPSDRDVLDAVMSQHCGTDKNCGTDKSKLKWLAISDTMSLGQFYCSTAYLDAIAANDEVTVLTPPEEIQFDDAGTLVGFAELEGFRS